MAWTNPRTWIPGEFVTASMLNTHLRDNLLYLFGVVKIATYTATLADVGPSVATEVTALSFVVPGGAWANGEQIRVHLPVLFKQNTGSNQNPVFKVNVGAGAQVTLKYVTSGGTGSSLFCGNDATEFKAVLYFYMRRVGNDVWVSNKELAMASDPGGSMANRPTIQELQVDGTSTPANFTGDNTVSFKVTLGASHASFYCKPQVAQVIHQRT